MNILSITNIYPEAIVLFIAFLLNIGIALVVLWKDYKSLVNRIFALMVLCFAFWNFTSLMSDWVDYVLQDPDKLLFWAKATIIGPIIAVFLFLYFSFIFPKREKFNIWVIFSFIPALILLCLTPFSFNIKEFYFSEELGVFQTKIGVLYDWFLIYCVLYLGLGIYNLIKKYKKLTGIYKVQVLYIIIGMTIVGLIGLSFNIVFPILGYDKLIIYGPLSTLIFSGIVAYAITRYRLMNVKVVLKKSFVYVLALTLLLAVVIFLSILIQFILQKYFSLDSYVSAVVVITLVVIFLPKAKKYFEEKFNSIFRKDYIDLAKKFEEIEDRMRLVSDMRLENFCKDLSEEMVKLFKLDKVSFYVLRNGEWVDYSSEEKNIIKNNESLIKNLRKAEGIIIRDELNYLINNSTKEDLDEKVSRNLAKEIKERDIVFIIPLFINSELKGFISGRLDELFGFFNKDLELLECIKDRTVNVLQGIIL